MPILIWYWWGTDCCSHCPSISMVVALWVPVIWICRLIKITWEGPTREVDPVNSQIQPITHWHCLQGGISYLSLLDCTGVKFVDGWQLQCTRVNDKERKQFIGKWTELDGGRNYPDWLYLFYFGKLLAFFGYIVTMKFCLLLSSLEIYSFKCNPNFVIFHN